MKDLSTSGLDKRLSGPGRSTAAFCLACGFGLVGLGLRFPSPQYRNPVTPALYSTEAANQSPQYQKFAKVQNRSEAVYSNTHTPMPKLSLS